MLYYDFWTKTFYAHYRLCVFHHSHGLCNTASPRSFRPTKRPDLSRKNDCIARSYPNTSLSKNTLKLIQLPASAPKNGSDSVSPVTRQNDTNSSHNAKQVLVLQWRAQKNFPGEQANALKIYMYTGNESLKRWRCLVMKNGEEVFP